MEKKKKAFQVPHTYGVCGAILIAKHCRQHKETRFHHVVKGFDLTGQVHLWQLRMALGVSLC